MKKSCLNCFNLRTTIPMGPVHRTLGQELLYQKATARCRKGNYEKSTGVGEKIVKNVLKGNHRYIQHYDKAIFCIDYDDVDE